MENKSVYKILAEEADRMLKENGYNIFGRLKTTVDPKQTVFEYRMPRCSFRGASRRS